MSLQILVARELWQEFDAEWRTLIDGDAAIAELLGALRVAGDKKRGSRCTALAREHAKKLEEAGRIEDAAMLIGTATAAGGNPSELRPDLTRLTEAAFGSEAWWPAYSELAGLNGPSDELRGAWISFTKLRAYQQGTLVFHPGGWGAGEITDVDLDERAISVTFGSGMRETFPMNAAIDIFIPLPEQDLRSLHFRDPESMRKQTKKEPLGALRTLLERHHGKATTAVIRNGLMQIGIEGSAWSAWWRKARKLAENSEWFDVSGSPQRSVIQLLLKAKDPAAGLRKALVQASDLAEVHGKVRELFIGQSVEEALKEVAIEELSKAVTVETEPLHERFGAWLFLRELKGETPEELKPALEEVIIAEDPIDPSIAPPAWEIFQKLSGSRDQERVVSILPELYGEHWMVAALRNLQHAAPGMVRPLVDALTTGGHADALSAHYIGLLARPLRAPTLLVALARQFDPGDHVEGWPTPLQRVHALLTLATHLNEARRGDPHMTRVNARLVEILTGVKKPLLRLLLRNAGVAGLRGLQLVLARGVDDTIDRLVTDIALEHDRQFFAGDAGPFWVGSTTWTTKSGLAKRSGELRELHDVKIPENQDAIGRAASYGDLSENAEWEAAIEEQRNLTNRAMEIEAELRDADLIENAAFLEDTICPGACVRYREIGTAGEISIKILGPWDGHLGEDVVSYLAPLAQGMLGMHSGESKKIMLPAGEVTVDILEVSPVELETV
ncbi:MAG: transcription elongation factor GreA [Planctomycetota bacterium]|jgi:transcription elongation factor GreA